MSDRASDKADRLEALLRRWGAEEAARREAVADAPALGPRTGRLATAGRWLPLAAGLVLFAAGAGMLALAGRAWLAAPPAAPGDGRADALEAKLADALARLQADRTALADADRRLGEAKREFAAEAERLRQAVEAERTRLAAEIDRRTDADRRAAALAAALEQQRGDLDGLGHRLRTAEEAADALQKDLVGRLAAHRELQTAHDRLAAEVAALRQAAGEALAARQADGERLAAMQQEQAAMLALVRQAYLASAAPGEEGLRARQLAARQNRLLRRGADLRLGLTDETLRRIFDTQEVLLMRLELLDPADRAQRESFLRLLRALDVAGQIDQALRWAAESPAVRTWLIENRLLLAEVDRAG